MERAISLNEIGLYSPQRQSAEVSKALFVIRQKQFNSLLKSITTEEKDSRPQHYLIIGQRGMGKSTLLRRIEVELHDEPYCKQFIPLLFSEEQYNVRNLATFWLNCLDALANSLESEKTFPETVLKIDKTISEISKNAPEVISEDAYKFLMDICRDLQRRPVLLIDNIDLVFKRLEKSGQHDLRSVLNENGAPIVVGGGVTVTSDVTEYDMPFYDFFQTEILVKLNYEEFVELLNHIAIVTHSGEVVLRSIREHSARQKSLLELTGGNPRIAIMLFKLIVKGFANDISTDLEALADEITPLYKARYEDLSEQQQIIIDAVAMNWDAIPLHQLSQATGYANNQLSPQLKRLVDEGWLETTPAYKAKGNAYLISERFFNIWYLIRCSRRHKKGVFCLSKFLECFYGKEMLDRLAKNYLNRDYHSEKDLLYAMALKESMMIDAKMRSEFEDKIISMKNKEILDDYFRGEIAKIGNKKIETALKQGEHKKAIEILTEVIGLEPDNFTTYYNRGTAYCNIGNYTEAIKDFNKAIQLEPNFVRIYHNRGGAYYHTDNYIEAIKDFSKVIELEPDFAFIYQYRGKAYYYTGSYVEAITDLSKAIDFNPNDVSTYFNRGQSYRETGNYTEAIKDFSKAIELEPDFADAYINRAVAYSNIGNNIEALADCNKAIELNDANSHLAILNKGRVLIDLKMYREAAEIWEIFLFNDSVRLIAALYLIFLYRDKLDKMERALELFNSIDEQGISQDEYVAHTYTHYLNKAGFELYSQNQGLAKKSLLQAFDIIENFDELATISNGHWCTKFSYVVVKLGYTSWLLEILEEKGYDITLSPYYTAIQALEIEKQKGEKEAEIYLKNRAVEISEPAKVIIEEIRKYMD